MTYIIKTDALCKQYKETTALNHVSLHIPKGSIFRPFKRFEKISYELFAGNETKIGFGNGPC